MMGILILVRHGQSTYNARGIWAGFTDCELTPLGRQEARGAGESLRDQQIDAVFVTDLKRAVETWTEMARVLKLTGLKPIVAPALKERDYGDLTGHSKWKLLARYGFRQWFRWRRGWDYPVPGGETLRDVYHRVAPYYRQQIRPLLEQGQTVLISAHGNSLRALVKLLEKVSDSQIPKLEIATGEIYVYRVNQQGKVTHKEIRKAHLR